MPDIIDRFVLGALTGAEANELPVDERGALEALRRATRRAVAPQLAAAVLRRLPNGIGIGGRAEVRARDLLERYVVQNGFAVSDLAELAEAMRARGIRCIVLKGGALAVAHLSEPHARHFDDLDVWFDPARAKEAVAALDDLGWGHAAGTERPGIDGRPLAQHGRSTHHALTARESPRGTLLDPHRHRPGRAADAHEDFERSYRRRHDVRCRGAVIATPAPDELLRELCHHVVVHHAAHPRYAWRHISDVHTLLECAVPRARAESLARRPRGGFAVGFSLRLYDAARRVASGSEAPPWARLWVAPSQRTMEAAATAWRTADVLERAGWDALHRPRYLGHKIFPARTFVADRYDVPVDHPSVLVGYLRHWRALGRIRAPEPT